VVLSIAVIGGWAGLRMAARDSNAALHEAIFHVWPHLVPRQGANLPRRQHGALSAVRRSSALPNPSPAGNPSAHLGRIRQI